MSFLCVQIRPFGKATNEFSYVSTTEEGQLIEENLDLGLDNYVPARKIMLKKYNSQIKSWNLIAEIEDKLPVDVYITASRLVVLCKKYDKGGTWYGAPISSLIMTGIERAVASAKRKNKILTGQVRYEWIEQILYSRKLKWSENETLCLHYRDTEKNLYRFIIWFNKDIDSSFIANEILHKACKYRLAMIDDKDDNELKFFKKYMYDDIKYDDDPKMMSSIRFPSKYYAPMGEKYRPTVQQLDGNKYSNNNHILEEYIEQDLSCPHCGSQILENDKFCINCGSDLTEASREESISNNELNNNLMCPKCNAELLSNSKFCGNCGYKIDIQEILNVEKNEKVQKLCSKCGTKLEASFDFCPVCGVKIN